MIGSTHLTIGALSGAALALVTHQPQTAALGMVAAAAVGALIPDIDHPQGAIRRRLGLLGDVSLFWMKHRNITHTALIVAFIGVLVVLAIRVPDVQQYSWFLWSFVAGYASHLAADSMTKDGIPLLWPLPGSFTLLPRGLCITTGGFLETLINAVATWGLVTIVLRIFGVQI